MAVSICLARSLILSLSASRSVLSVFFQGHLQYSFMRPGHQRKIGAVKKAADASLIEEVIDAFSLPTISFTALIRLRGL